MTSLPDRHFWLDEATPQLLHSVRFIIHKSIRVSQEPCCDWRSIELYRPHC